MLVRILSDICVILVLAVGIAGFLLLLLCLLDKLVKDLLLWLRVWRTFIMLAHGRCPHCNQSYRTAKEARQEIPE